MTVTLGNPVAPLEEVVAVGTAAGPPLASGEMAKFFSADRGCSRSGDKARRKRGDPGSADLGRDPIRATERCFAAGETDSDAPGLNSCVECELPGG